MGCFKHCLGRFSKNTQADNEVMIGFSNLKSPRLIGVLSELVFRTAVTSLPHRGNSLVVGTQKSQLCMNINLQTAPKVSIKQHSNFRNVESYKISGKTNYPR